MKGGEQFLPKNGNRHVARSTDIHLDHIAAAVRTMV